MCIRDREGVPECPKLNAELVGKPTVSICLSVCLGVRRVAECMVNSLLEETCETARRLLYCLGLANPRFTVSVYKGLVALFSCNLPVVQRMAANTVRRLQVYIDTSYNTLRIYTSIAVSTKP